MLIMAIGALQNAFVLRQGFCREHVLPRGGAVRLVRRRAAAGGVWGMGGVLLARPSGDKWMRWAGALFCWPMPCKPVRRRCGRASCW